MAELRWVLLVAGIVVLGGLFLWTRYKPKLGVRIRLPGASAGAASPTAGAPRRDPVVEEPVSPPRLPEKIVTIRLMSKGSGAFAGEDLVLALREAGLRHGRFGIFHCFPDGEEGEPVFSVASLVEPGSFDLTRLRSDSYLGVSLFFGMPGPVDGVQAFDAMISAARAMARQLGGELMDEHGSTLSVQRERYLREEVIQFQHQLARTG